MKVRALIPLSLLVIASCGDGKIKKDFADSVKNYMSAWKSQSWEKMASYMFPKVISSSGGVAALSQLMANSLSSLQISEWSMDSITLFSDSTKSYFASCKVTSIIKTNQPYAIKMEAGLVGRTTDNGNNWCLTSTDSAGMDALSQYDPMIFRHITITKTKTFIQKDNAWVSFNIDSVNAVIAAEGVLNEYSGIWKSEDGTVVTIDFSGSNRQLTIHNAAKDLVLPVQPVRNDPVNDILTLFAIQQQDTISLRKMWVDESKTSFHLRLIDQQGDEYDLSFLRNLI